MAESERATGTVGYINIDKLCSCPVTLTPDDDLALRLMVLSARVTRFVRRHGPADTAATWRALSILAEHESMRLGEFAQLDQLSQPTATAKMNRLVAAGLVGRSPDPSDGRATRFTLTPAGHRRLDELRQIGLASIGPGIERLDDQRRAQLSEALEIVRTLLDEAADDEHQARYEARQDPTTDSTMTKRREQ